MNWKNIIGALAITTLLFLSACDVVMGTPVRTSTNIPPTVPQVQIDQAVSATLSALTQVAQTTPTLPVETQVALSVQQTLTAFVTDTPQFTWTPSLTPTNTLTPTPETPRVTVSADTFCRKGPGKVYEKLGVMLVGESAEVVGRSHNSDNWVIKLPSNPAITCWLWAYYASVTGDTSAIPVVTPPPSPTP